MVLVVVVAAGQQQQIGTEPVHPLLQQVHQLAQADGVQALGELPIPVGDLVAEPEQLVIGVRRDQQNTVKAAHSAP
ncbi:hypothetical protein ACTWPT_55730 [Nonomuraea sp. 3N208]|uniref:hypothetical protein n=1 Tax=Nonomuraea sp. 3N208 TaxID=3457421 RepID=UPI003FD68BAF